VTRDGDDDPQGPPWHERTSTVVGASIAGLLVIGLLFLLGSYIARSFNEPDQAPQYYLDVPGSTSSRSYSTSATTTTETVTSTSPPVTTDINGDETTTSSSTDTTSGPTYPPTTRRTRTTDDNGESTSRNRPRLNETRTLYPQP
jgi:cytoskeletal protein RodZ